MQDIHDIRPPVPFGFDPGLFNIILMASGVIILFVLAFFLIRKFFKKRKTINGMMCLPAPMAPCEAALKELDLILQRQMNDPRLFYFDLTAVLRKYIGRSFGINAIEMTSQEFIRGINLLDLDPMVKKEIAGFQKYCDPFKYAGLAPEKDPLIQDISFIKKTILQIEEDLIKQKQEKMEKQKGKKEEKQ